MVTLFITNWVYLKFCYMKDLVWIVYVSLESHRPALCSPYPQIYFIRGSMILIHLVSQNYPLEYRLLLYPDYFLWDSGGAEASVLAQEIPLKV